MSGHAPASPAVPPWAVLAIRGPAPEDQQVIVRVATAAEAEYWATLAVVYDYAPRAEVVYVQAVITHDALSLGAAH